MPPRGWRTDWALPLYGGIFDYIEVVLSCMRSGTPDAKDVKNFFIGLFCPPLLLWKSMRGLAEKQKGATDPASSSENLDRFMTAMCALLYGLFFLFHILAW